MGFPPAEGQQHAAWTGRERERGGDGGRWLRGASRHQRGERDRGGGRGASRLSWAANYLSTRGKKFCRAGVFSISDFTRAGVLPPTVLYSALWIVAPLAFLFLTILFHSLENSWKKYFMYPITCNRLHIYCYVGV